MEGILWEVDETEGDVTVSLWISRRHMIGCQERN